MAEEISRVPLPALLGDLKSEGFRSLHVRLAERGFDDIRPGHGCVFRSVDRDHGSRLTHLAEQSGLTKQAVGEVVADLEELGYVCREPDPLDGRAKVIKTTERGNAAMDAAREVFDEIESEWAERVGEERMATVREVLEELAVGVPTPEPLRG
jgi:DNA-binding MarR family transcriptional regulator